MSQSESNYDPRTGVSIHDPSNPTPNKKASKTPSSQGASIHVPGVTPDFEKKRGFWQNLKDPFINIPVVGGVAEAIYDVLPIDNAIRSGEEFKKGNWVGGLGNLGLAGLETAALVYTGGAASAAVKGTSGAAKLARGALNTVGPNRYVIGMNTAENYWPGGDKPAPAPAAPANPTVQAASAADFRKWEESQKPPKTPEQLAAEEAARQKALKDAQDKERLDNLARELGIAGGTLAPLTPEQIEAIASQERAAQRQYDNLLNQYLLQERQGRQRQEAEVGQARRQAAGQQQDISTQLAALGMDVSPGSALSGETAVFQEQQAREAASIRTLADILAQAASGRTVARSDLEAALGAVNKERVTMQTANTQANLDRYLSMIAEQ
jgi:hypothetical protein